jgi:hypothetical protein
MRADQLVNCMGHLLLRQVALFLKYRFQIESNLPEALEFPYLVTVIISVRIC